ncbi:helix-turn-helix transcriptional regulator [Nocardia sp. NPDC049220]|uniref:helix-turn-helix domain-containing protein n=1 Tax=Nocardia sp. NPDC049220 TaxID=3155273 RepID=UPI0033D9025B
MTNVGQAGAALGARLRELRRDARLSGRDLATACDWHPSKVSRLELGRQQPSEEDLLVWCRVTDAMMVYDDLIATLRNLRSAHMEWRRALASGRAHRQRQSLEFEGRAGRIRWFEAWVIPGLLQTPAYAKAILTTCSSVISGGRDDIDEAVAIRMTRQRVLRSGSRRFVFVIAEAALRQTIGSAAIMTEQLHMLNQHAANPCVKLAVIPASANACIGSHGFAMFDSESVMVETISAELTITRPSEIAVYDMAFGILYEMALRDAAATNLITDIAAGHSSSSQP